MVAFFGNGAVPLLFGLFYLTIILLNDKIIKNKQKMVDFG